MDDYAISVKNISKRFRINPQENSRATPTLREDILKWVKRPLRLGKPDLGKQTIWALSDVSFDVHRGEVLGLIGRNGSGKSTLLKILAGITKPTSGEAIIDGNIGTLLEVGTGFHSELTGRENVYISGNILGMSRNQIQEKFDEILEFAEIGKFIDTPIKRYSSGMKIRLGFSVAAFFNPEILLVDEVLAVGDTAFRKKCLNKMQEIASEGRTVIFVSHNMGAIEMLCDNAIFLENGQIKYQGKASDAVAVYMETQEPLELPTEIDLITSPKRQKFFPKFLKHICMTDINGIPSTHFLPLSDIVFDIELDGTSLAVDDLDLHITVINNKNLQIAKLKSLPMSQKLIQVHGIRVIRCTWEKCPLAPGFYSINLWANHKNSINRIDQVNDAIRFQIMPFPHGQSVVNDLYPGMIYPSGHWDF